MHARAQSAGPAIPLVLHAGTPEATDRIGGALAAALAPGDVVALRGPLGVGKSHLARAVIRARLGDPAAEVPSPTYTLVNIYAAPGGEIWHADLYRVDDEETAEIGLADALGHAILLVEWPERWPGLPERRLDVTLAPRGDGRDVTLVPAGPGWQGALEAARGVA